MTQDNTVRFFNNTQRERGVLSFFSCNFGRGGAQTVINKFGGKVVTFDIFSGVGMGGWSCFKVTLRNFAELN